MVNGLHLYSTFIDPLVTKALYICLTFTHSLTHLYTKGAIQLVQLMDTSRPFGL